MDEQNNPSNKSYNQPGQIVSGNQVNVLGDINFYPYRSDAEISDHVNIDLAKNAWQNKVVVDYDELFGVDEMIDTLKRKLIAERSAPIISLFGPGGIGKTTIAYDLIKQHAGATGFSRIAWVSVRGLFTTDSGEERREIDADFFWAGVLAELAAQLNISSLAGKSRTSWSSLFATEMEKIAKNEKCLIVIDNLERTRDTERIIKYFNDSNIIKYHKLFVTTRVSSQIYSKLVSEHEVKPLSLENTTHFIHHLGEGDSNIDSLSSQDFQDIYEITRGNPYLIRLVARTFSTNRLPISEVIMNLKESPVGESQEIFESSIVELIEEVGEKTALSLLSAFCAKGDANEPFDAEDLYKYSLIEDRKQHINARTVACNLALIQASEGYRKFTIHSLLKEFICNASSFLA